MAIDTAILFLVPDFLSVMPICMLIGIDLVAFIRLILFTCMGMYCCSVLELRAFPAVRSLRTSEKYDRWFQKPFLVLIGATVVLAVCYSVILFTLTTPQISEFLRQLPVTQSAKLGVGDRPSLLMALVLLEFAFAEEIVFRLGIQNYLARLFRLQGNRYWIAIVLTGLFWSLAHASILDPEWVKIAQVFPLGLALGYVFKQYGTEACILVHGVFNVIMMFLAPFLIST
ncbi:MAG: lysostaphin resistance A-like protein [Planctomycetota bacterium]